MKYIISPITTYDSDDCLWYTKVGLNNPEMTLYGNIAGKTPVESRFQAISLVEMLNLNVKEQ